MTDVLTLLFKEDFLIRALFSGILISVCCALLGVSLVLKRFSMIGDGLSHVGFGALAIAAAAGIAPLGFAIPIVVIAAFMLLRMNEKGKIKGDTAIALVSTGALAVGVMATSLTSGMNIDIYNYMFGSILTVTDNDLILCASLAASVVTTSVICYHEIFASAFDESFAKATGTKTSAYNMLVAVLTAVTVVVGMRMMGALLISSLIIFPTVISMRVSKSYKSVVITSVLTSVLCFVFGLLFSIRFEAPAGASVVCVNIICLVLFTLISKILSARKLSSFIKKMSAVVLSLAVIVPSLVFILLGEVNVYEKEKPSVVTTNFASYDFAREIAGDKADITMLLSPGEESHTFEPTVSDIQKIKNADIFICTGGESESWVETILTSAETDGCRIIRMLDISEKLHTIHEGSEDAHIHNHEEEYDEHVWTSVKNAELICKAIEEALSDKDKENKSFYEERLLSYTDELTVLSDKFRLLSEKAKGKPFIIADRFPLLYLFTEFSLDYEAVFPGCSAQSEVNPVRLSALSEQIRNESIRVIYKLDLNTGTVASSLSESTGAEVETLYSCHTVSQEDFEKGETYISLMTKNYERLLLGI